MAVVWIENQLRENKTKELILQYANQVTTRDLLCLDLLVAPLNLYNC
jgi:hypothetical protein